MIGNVYDFKGYFQICHHKEFNQSDSESLSFLCNCFSVLLLNQWLRNSAPTEASSFPLERHTVSSEGQPHVNWYQCPQIGYLAGNHEYGNVNNRTFRARQWTAENCTATARVLTFEEMYVQLLSLQFGKAGYISLFRKLVLVLDLNLIQDN